ncbi:HAMP domain-containing sensor histidine kinase [Streptomyces sp. NBC_01565]|uniref:HAMP domain-containing sensor histidine kinase n=1 Tax=Streptomyces sp. NBC_01565 TaxID=2975881 RepID=UPI0022542BA6|nr:HAMP domain-containing sensor histidine kinase [Streptomyces sp. NBC_01565]MCX4539835.1 HAMP domain-containing histidine kinase [Streptomyces sp. NBC_01565]
MRRSLAGVALAVTSMVALSFLIPLAVLVMSLARQQSITAAEQPAAAMAPILTLTTDPDDLRESMAGLDRAEHLVIHLPGSGAIGTSHAPAELLERAERGRESISQDVPDGGWIYLQPVVLPQDRVAVVENYVPESDLTRGVAASWTVMVVLAVGLLIGSVLVADRLGAKVVRSSKELAQASYVLGEGNLSTRVVPMGPSELRDAGVAFNAMADRMTELLAIERELVADLSHRLRTPLTALHLATERMGPSPESGRVEAAVCALEAELQAIITTARTPLAMGPMGRALRDAGSPPSPSSSGASAGRPPGERSEAGEVIRRRAGFWAVLAEQQDRCCTLDIAEEATTVDLADDDIAAVVDALVGNVFRYTADGTAFAISVDRTAQAVELLVEDEGPGIPDPDLALARGSSTSSTGLGLDIVRRAAAATGGSVHIGGGALGGASVRVTFGLSTDIPRNPLRGRRRRGNKRRRPS